MHARDLAELAALVAIHSPLIVEGAGRVPHEASEQYWTASKCRLDRWMRWLRQLTAAAGEAVRPATLGQAARIEGVTAAALTLVLAHVKGQKGKNALRA